MKKPMKTRPHVESYSAADTARLLGVSVPTVRRMEADGQLEGFSTPGGHLRIVAESIEALRGQRQNPRPLYGPSPALRNRRERIEELALDVQELRTKRELERMRREDVEEVERRAVEEEEREQEAAERREALELERRRLEFEQLQEEERREAEHQLEAFHSRWLNAATEALSSNELRGLSPADRKEILDGLEAEIKRRTPRDQPRMLAIMRHTIEVLMEPILAAHEASKTRHEAVERALWHLSGWATESEKAQAYEAARRAVAALPDEATDTELRVAADEAIKPVHQAVEKRLLDQRVLTWVDWQLVSVGDDRDRAKLRRKCAEILTGLPCHVPEPEAKAALEATITQTRQEIEQRQAHKRREEQKANLIKQGVAEVSDYLWRLKEDGEITSEEFWDSDYRAELERAVKESLESEITGKETIKGIAELVHEIVDSNLT